MKVDFHMKISLERGEEEDNSEFKKKSYNGLRM